MLFSLVLTCLTALGVTTAALLLVAHRAGYTYELAFRQFEISDTRVFDRPQAGRSGEGPVTIGSRERRREATSPAARRTLMRTKRDLGETIVRRTVAATVVVAVWALLIGPAPSSAATPPEPKAAEPASAPDQLLVGYSRGTTSSERADARQRASSELLERVVRGSSTKSEVELVRIPQGMTKDAAIRRLEADPNVEYAEPNWVITVGATSNDPYYTNGSLWGVYGDATTPANQYGSQAGEAWVGGNVGSDGAYIGIIDEGIDYNHPDLDGNIWTNSADPVDGIDNDGNGYVDDIHGWDFHNNDSSVYDGGNSDKHGTHVSGTVAGEGGNGIGVAGVAWDATLISGKFLGPSGGYISNAVKAVNYMTDLKTREQQKLNVVATNNSWGGGGYSQSMHDAIIRSANQNILFIAAAGNDGTNNDSTVRYPSSYDTTVGTSTQTKASYDAVVAVAAITSSGSLASWSNYGLKNVDLGAPGAGVYSTLPKSSYGSYSGTSMATPHVTGAAVLINASSGAAGAALRTALLAAVTATASLSGKTVIGGRLDLTSLAGPIDSPPSVTGLSPVDGSALVGDTVDVSATATDDKSVMKVEFFATPSGGSRLLIAGDTSSPYSVPWNLPADGSYVLEAVATDTIGQTGVASANVTVDNVDDPPTVSITSPEADSIVSGTVTVAASASDDRGVASVKFFATLSSGSPSLIDEDTSSPYSVSWQPPDGNYELTAVVMDSASQTATSAPVAVSVATPTTPTSAVVESIGYRWFGGKNNNNHLEIAVTVLDNLGQPVSGAAVSVDVYRAGSKYGSATGTTNSDGVALFSAKNAPSGCYTTDVTTISAGPLAYDGTEPPNQGCK